MEKVELSFLAISRRIREIEYPEIDLVVGIATGGVVPASLLAFHLQVPLEIIHLNYRDETNKPRFASPKFLKKMDLSVSGKRILLVDDVSVSGKTLEKAREVFDQSTVITMVMKGKADICAFANISQCVYWPWKV
jgi:uncharacterized protein